MLTNTHIISNFNKGDVFQLIPPQTHQKRWSKCSHADFRSVWDTLTSWLSKEGLERLFLERAQTKSLTVCNFRNTLALRIFFFFFNYFKCHEEWINGTKNREKVFRLSDNCNMNRERQIATIRERIRVIGSQCVNKDPYDFKLQ